MTNRITHATTFHRRVGTALKGAYRSADGAVALADTEYFDYQLQTMNNLFNVDYGLYRFGIGCAVDLRREFQ